MPHRRPQASTSRLRAYLHARMIANYDEMMRPLERRLFNEARRRLLARASGRVLEIGVGTGANIALYPRGVDRIVGIDPELRMLAQARARSSNVALVACSAEALPFEDNSVDTVVATLVFCTIPDPRRALDEVARVLRPGGLLLMLEHTRARLGALAMLQDALTPLQRLVAGGCHLNRATRTLVERHGFETSRIRERFNAMVLEIEAVRP